jgi:TANFOR domain-containing protein
MKRFLSSLYSFFCTLLLLLSAQQVTAQVWPTQVNTIITPPYSPFTSDYVNTPGKMIVNLLLRDINASNVQVRLRISMEGQGTGVKITTNPNAAIPPITLDGGVSLRLSDADLAPYFRAENLVFNGMTASQYTSTGGKLPEDLYRICFEAFEFKTGTRISVSNGCANAWIMLNDPPLLNLPTNAVKVSVTNPSIVTFSWTPRHKGSPNAAFATEYLFQLVELLPGFDRNPTAAFLSSIPLYETTTRTTQLVYGMMGEVPLEAGRSYAWRVKAKSIVGAQEMDLFKNQGFSEIWYFTYSGDCATPTDITAKAKGTSRVEISWSASGNNQEEYIVSCRKSGVANAVWFTTKTTGTSLTIADLSPGTTYDYKVRASCGIEGESTESTADTVSTLTDVPVEYTCGMISPDDTISNMQPLAALAVRDEIKAGFFTVKVTKVSGSGGNFSGEGYISVPLLKKAKIAVNFTNILVNTDYKLAKGVILTAYDPSWSGVNDLDKYFEGGGKTGTVVTGKDAADVTVDVTIPGPENIKVTTNAAGGGTLTITGADGSVVERSVDQLPATVKDKDGNIYKANADGTIQKIAAAGNNALPASGELNTVHADVATVTFMPHAKQTFAFDAFRSDYLKSQLIGAAYQKLADNYYVPAKAIAASQTDLVKAQISIKNSAAVNIDSVRFVTGTGTRFEAKKLDNTSWEITVLGGPANDAQELYALATGKDGKTITLGKLLIASYEVQERKVVLVPVNGGSVDTDAITRSLQRVYGPLGITWKVVPDEPFTDNTWDLDGDGLMDAGSGGLLTSRTREMKQLSTIYGQARGIDDAAVYLFIMRNGKDKDKLLAGDMPRSQQFGYIFTDGVSDIGWTVAHEIAHGAYHLRHSFDGYGFNESDLQDNLMNYKAGLQLNKFQWDAMHDPGVVWGLFETDADGEAAAAADVSGIVLEKETDFATVDGFLITLPKGATVLAYCDNGNVPYDGLLLKFKDKGKIYQAGIESLGTVIFHGYRSAGGEYYKASIYRSAVPKQVTAVIQVATDKADQKKLTLTVQEPTYQVQLKSKDQLYGNDQTEMVEVFGDAKLISTGQTNPAASCKDGLDWSKEKSYLGELGKKLNHAIKVVIDDGSGKKQTVTTGANPIGTLTYTLKNGNWSATVKLDNVQKKNSRDSLYKPGDLLETEKIIETEINKKLAKFEVDENGNSRIKATDIEPLETGDGGSFNFGSGLTWLGWGGVLMDAGTSIYENAAMPETYWNKDDKKFPGYPIHGAPTMCGVGDGVIGEVTEIPQLVKFGLELATDKDKVVGLWNSVKKITPASIKDAVVEGAKNKWDKYANSPMYITTHEVGKDAVAVFTMISGAGIFKGGAKITDAVAATGEGIGEASEKVLKNVAENAGQKEVKGAVADATGELPNKPNTPKTPKVDNELEAVEVGGEAKPIKNSAGDGDGGYNNNGNNSGGGSDGGGNNSGGNNNGGNGNNGGDGGNGGNGDTPADDLPGGENPLEKFLQSLRKRVEFFMQEPASLIKSKYPDAKVGYRGSVANGKRFDKDTRTFKEFNPESFDVDAFIVDDKLAKKLEQLGQRKTWRDVRGLNDPEIEKALNDLERTFSKKIKGYRVDPNKPFTFRVFTEYQYKYEIIPTGCKLVN